MFTSFARGELDAKPLFQFVQSWKQWTSKRILRELKMAGTIWQAEFFDHVLRNSESYSEKCGYVRQNPVRAGFVSSHELWPYQGELVQLEAM